MYSRWKYAGIIAVAAVTVMFGGARMFQAPEVPLAHANELTIVVSSTEDDVSPETPACPSETLCTLREAIATANADASNDPVRITFDSTAFPLDEPAAIEVGPSPLPALSRPDAVIDGSMAGVVLIGPTLEGPEASGLTITGAGSGVIGLQIGRFQAACIFLDGPASFAGDPSDAGRNHLDDCNIGILATGAGAVVQGNVIGMQPGDPEALIMQSGVVAAATDVVVGGEGSPIPLFNAIGNVQTAVQVGRGAGEAFAGVVIRNNLIGESYARSTAPVATGVLLDHPSDGTEVIDNAIRNAGTGIVVAADEAGESIVGNTLTGNTYAMLEGLAIDLGGDGVHNPNDEGDADTGPNTFLNSPVITNSTQALLAGTACSNCRVTLYQAMHEAGGEDDFPLEPIIGGDVFADAAGSFTIASPLVSPGDWLMANATDEDGNTSEFSPSVYVGAGTVQCGNVSLQPGWNFVGYFGTTASLETDVVPDTVRSVHQLGAGGYSSWFPEGESTLTFLQTGEPYWLWSKSQAGLGGGISLSTALPVPLSEGWNDFVYIGAAVDVLDALASIEGSWSALYRFENTGAMPGRWQSYGAPDIPSYASAFDLLQPCTAYRILMTADDVLEPLEP